MNVEKELEKIILDYYKRPKRYDSFTDLIFDLHSKLINDDELIVREPGVYKTKILGNK